MDDIPAQRRVWDRDARRFRDVPPRIQITLNEPDAIPEIVTWVSGVERQMNKRLDDLFATIGEIGEP
jgi:hypothetical protein